MSQEAETFPHGCQGPYFIFISGNAYDNWWHKEAYQVEKESCRSQHIMEKYHLYMIS